MPRAWRRLGCVCGTECSMSSFVCELSVESRFVRPPFNREPCPPFYRRRGEQGLQVKNTKGIEGPSKGLGLPFPPSQPQTRPAGVRGWHVRRVLVC